MCNNICFKRAIYTIFYCNLLSILDYVSPDKEYEIVVLTSEIDLYDCNILLDLVKPYPNVRLKFFDPNHMLRNT